MKQTVRLLALALAFTAPSGAFAQSHLRIGIGDDPDALRWARTRACAKPSTSPSTARR